MAYGRSDIKEAHKRISEYFNDSLEVIDDESKHEFWKYNPNPKEL